MTSSKGDQPTQPTEPRGCPTPGACSAIAEIERLRALVTELADDLEAEINARYPEAWREYPSEQRRYERDMELVRRARAAVGAGVTPEELER